MPTIVTTIGAFISMFIASFPGAQASLEGSARSPILDPNAPGSISSLFAPESPGTQ